MQKKITIFLILFCFEYTYSQEFDSENLREQIKFGKLSILQALENLCKRIEYLEQQNKKLKGHLHIGKVHLLYTLKQGHSVNIEAQISFSPDSKTMAVAGRNVFGIRLWNMQDGKLTKVLGKGAMHIQYSPNKPYIVSAAADALSIWDTKKGIIKDSLQISRSSKITALAYSHDGKWIAFAMNNKVTIWDIDKKESFSLNSLGKSIRLLAFSKKPKILICTVGSHHITVYNLETRKIIANLVHPQQENIGSPYIFAMNTSANHLATGDGRGVICIWDLTQNKIIGQFSEHPYGISNLAFSPSGTLLLSGSNGRTKKVALWNIEKKAWRFLPLQQKAIVESVAYSPDGTMIAVGMTNGIVIVWKLEIRK